MFCVEWERDQEGVVLGEEIELYDSAYGHNDDLMNRLKQLGLWDTLTSMKPDLKKRNGTEQLKSQYTSKKRRSYTHHYYYLTLKSTFS